MRTAVSMSTLDSRRKQLAVCVASIFALSAPAISLAATSWPVTSCADNGPGSLRDVIGAVTTLSGDTVDLSGLTGNNACANSKISLSTGDIVVTQTNLTIRGPGAGVLTIDGSGSHFSSLYPRLLTHTGTGTLTIKDLSLKYGYIYHVNYKTPGGCVYSDGNVDLFNVQAKYCQVQSSNLAAEGGAIYAKGNVRLFSSTVAKNSTSSGNSSSRGGGVFAKGDIYLKNSFVGSNTAIVGGNGKANGGGIFSAGQATIKYSTLSGNSVASTSAYSSVYGGGASVTGNLGAKYSTISANQATSSFGNAVGGGILANSNVTIDHSTISDNTSNGSYGGIDAFAQSPAGKTFLMRNSTISGNSATSNSGGIYVNSGTAGFYNSTIAFNTSGLTAPGVMLSASIAPVSATLRSNLISNNSYSGGGDNDLDTRGGPTFNSSPANNLIRVTFAAGLPGDTSHACPYLGPLRRNGGLTRTHALMSKSPAIDNGNDDLIDPVTQLPYLYEQRGGSSINGGFDYLRVSGPAADIGAYEVQQDDVVFNTTFDGCG